MGCAPAIALEQEADRRRIVLTFDDVPVTGECDAARIRDVTEGLTSALAHRGAPAAALVTPIACVEQALLDEVLARWQDVGAAIGNHSFTHPDLNATAVADYTTDIERAQERIEQTAPVHPRWFRPPYLHMGDDPEKKAAVERWLKQNDYRLAPVTVDNQEWVYAAVYEAAVSAGDEALARRTVGDYLRHIEASVAFYEDLSRAVLGRELPQILLLHANRLNADHLVAIMDLLQARGYAFVSMDEAATDPAYERRDPYVGSRGLSWLQRWALDEGVEVPDEPREHPWVARAFQGGGEPEEPEVEADSADEAEVRRALERYLAGHATGRAAHFDSAFHETANLYWVAEGELRTRTAAAYIGGSSGRPAPDEEERSRRIAWVEVADEIAIARVDLDYPAARFTDYMSLVRVNGDWRIIAKLYDIHRSAEGPERSDTERDTERSIGAASRAFSEAYVAGDTATIRELYTEDAVLLPPDGEVRGRDAIVRYFTFGTGRTNVSHAMESSDLRIREGMAIDAGTWSNTIRVGDGPESAASGPYLVIWRRGEDGRWRIEYDAWHRP